MHRSMKWFFGRAMVGAGGMSRPTPRKKRWISTGASTPASRQARLRSIGASRASLHLLISRSQDSSRNRKRRRRTMMVFKRCKKGGGWHEPPYTWEEEMDLYRRMSPKGGSLSITALRAPAGRRQLLISRPNQSSQEIE